MITVILVAHILVSIILIAVVLMQRSEGGALGIGGGGGGGGGGGLMSGRGVAGALVRTTMIFGGIFFITSIGLTTLASRDAGTETDIQRELQEEFAPEIDDSLGLGAGADILDLDIGEVVDPLATDTSGAEPASPATSDDPLSEPTDDQTTEN